MQQNKATKIFKMGRAQMVGRMLMQSGIPYIAVAAFVLLVALILGIVFDIRFLIVALLILFIVAPMMLSLLYFNYGLRPECCMNVLPHTLTLTPDGVRYDIYIESQEEGEEESTLKKHNTRTVAYSLLRPYMVLTRSVSIPVVEEATEKKVGFVWVPSTAFEDDGMTEFMQEIGKRLGNENN